MNLFLEALIEYAQSLDFKVILSWSDPAFSGAIMPLRLADCGWLLLALSPSVRPHGDALMVPRAEETCIDAHQALNSSSKSGRQVSGKENNALNGERRRKDTRQLAW